jgi:hypothetical protein
VINKKDVPLLMNVFKQLFSSLYSPKLISTFRLQGIWKTILYVFILALLSTIPTAYHFSSGLTAGLIGIDQTLRNDLPFFSIEDHTLSAEADQPIEIKKDNFIIILDDTGTYGVDEVEAKRNAIGILKDRFVFVTNGQTQSYEYSLMNMSFSKQDIIEFSDQVNQFLPIFVSILCFVMYLFSSIVKFIEITILAIFGLAFKNSLQKVLTFKQVWILSAYATTLSTFFFFVMDSLQVVVPGGFLVNWFVHLIILYLTLKEIPSTKTA